MKKETAFNVTTLFRTFIFYMLFIILIPPTAILMWVIPLTSNVTPWAVCRVWGRTVNFILYVLCKVKIEIENKEPLSPEPYLIIANHTGPWETVALLPFINKDFTYVLKKNLIHWKYTFFSLGLRALHPIPISREANAGDFNTMVNLSQKHFAVGRSVLIFPGGTRKDLQKSLDFGPGGILLAKKLKCPILPLFIDSECWTRGKYIKDYGAIYPGTIRIKFGNLISKEEILDKKAKEIYSELLKFMTESSISLDEPKIKN